jgi:hypothetical protein
MNIYSVNRAERARPPGRWPAGRAPNSSPFGLRHSDFGIRPAFRYVFAEAAGHTDGHVARQTLPGALEWLWRRYCGQVRGMRLHQ